MTYERTAWDDIYELFHNPRGLCECPAGREPEDDASRCTYHRGHDDGWALLCMLQCAGDLVGAEGVAAMLRDDLATGRWDPDCTRWALIEAEEHVRAIEAEAAAGADEVKEPYAWARPDPTGRLMRNGAERLSSSTDDELRAALEAVLPPPPHIEAGWPSRDARRWEALTLLYARLRTYGAFYAALTSPEWLGPDASAALPPGQRRDALAGWIWRSAVEEVRAAEPIEPQRHHLVDRSMRGAWTSEELEYLFTLQDDPGKRRRLARTLPETTSRLAGSADVERIDGLLDAVREVWLQHPDMRLTELVWRAASAQRRVKSQGDFFYMDDELLQQGVNRLWGSATGFMCALPQAPLDEEDDA